MPSYAIPPGLQVFGGAIQFIVDGGFGEASLRASRILVEEGVGKLDEKGLILIDRNSWHPVAGTLRAYERIARELGEIVLYRAGASIPPTAVFPPGIRSAEGALRSINLAYYLHHGVNGEPLLDAAKGVYRGNIGEYRVRKDGERRVLVECENPYPCDFDLGLIEAMARRFEPRAAATHVASLPCRKRGAKLCSYSVAW
jgi:hypothetical protein